jgi:hypothetical protein
MQGDVLMDSLTQFTIENGVFAIIGALISFVFTQLFAMSKICKVNAERNKLLVQTKGLEEKIAREREVWEERNTAMFSAYVKIIPATKTKEPISNQFERLDDRSFFKAEVPVTNFGDKQIIIEGARFIGQEKFVDNGYGASKLVLETIDKQMLLEGEVHLGPKETKTFSFDYCIGKRFNDRMAVDVFVKARVGIKPPIEKKFSDQLVYIY